MAYPVTPKTWVAGDVLTAAQLNAELRDALLGAFPLGPPDAAWMAYTPTLTQTVAVTKTETYAKYQRIGRTIHVQLYLTVTGAGTAATAIVIGLPVPAANGSLRCGIGQVYDSSANIAYGAIVALATTTTAILAPTSVDTIGTLGSAVFTAALAGGDIVHLCATYEAAT